LLAQTKVKLAFDLYQYKLFKIIPFYNYLEIYLYEYLPDFPFRSFGL